MSERGARLCVFRAQATAVAILAVSWFGSTLAAYAAAASEADAPGSVRTLAHAIETALAYSPLLTSVPFERVASEAQRDQASQRPQWDLSTTAENVLGRNATAGVRAAEATVEFGRTLERGGKRAARMNVAEREAAVLAEDLTGRGRELIAEVKRRFTDVLEHQALGEIRSTQSQLIEELVPVAQRRVSSGRASRAELASLRAVSARAQMALEQEQSAQASAQQGLAAVIGRPEWATGTLQGNLAETPRLPEEDVMFSAVESAPRVRAAQREAELARARVQAAQSTAAPDVHVAAGVRRLQELHSEAFVLSWSVPLGTGPYSRPAIRAADAQLKAAMARVEGARVQVRVALAETWGNVQRSHRAIGALAREVLPAAVEAAEVLERGYRQGRFSLIEVTTARQTATDAQLELTSEEARYRRALADLELGLDMSAVPAGVEPRPTP